MDKIKEEPQEEEKIEVFDHENDKKENQSSNNSYEKEHSVSKQSIRSPYKIKVTDADGIKPKKGILK